MSDSTYPWPNPEPQPEDEVEVRAIRRCVGYYPPGPDTEMVIVEPDETDTVPWAVARRWYGAKRCTLTLLLAEKAPSPTVGDLVQWVSQGDEQWSKRKRIQRIEEDYAFFDGSETGIPLTELEA